MSTSWRFITTFLAAAVIFGGVGIAFASQTDGSAVEQINGLQDQIDEKQSHLDAIEQKIEEYRKKISSTQTQVANLHDALELLDNRITKAELDIEANTIEIDSVNTQIELLDTKAREYEAQLIRERQLLGQVLQKMQTYDNDMGLQLLFGTNSFSELFNRLQLLENVNSDLVDTLNRAEDAKQRVKEARTEQEGKKQRLLALQEALKDHKNRLDEERGAKDSLLAQSQKSEAQYQILVYDLREEMAYIDHQVAVLQGEIEAKLNDVDGGVGSSVMSWPVDPTYRGISTTFHDPTYPFRHLFEHSGLDIPQRQGTAVISAAPGYVAWTRTGSMYGNYVMVIHSDGVATLYAHLSKVLVKQDQFVGRGDTLALSGGQPGSPGAGLSTGPHLHFEVRKDGIPVDPMSYLVSY